MAAAGEEVGRDNDARGAGVDQLPLVLGQRIANDALVIGTRSGVFVTQSTAFGTWAKYGTGLPDVLVYDMTYNATDDVLVIGSLGRGAWKVSGASLPFSGSGAGPSASITSGSGNVTLNATAGIFLSGNDADILSRAQRARSLFDQGDFMSDVVVSHARTRTTRFTSSAAVAS